MAVPFYVVITNIIGLIAGARCLYFLIRIYQTRRSRTGKDFDIFNVPIFVMNILAALVIIHLSIQSLSDQNTSIPSCNVHFIVFGYTLVSACFAYLSTNCAEIAGEIFISAAQ